MELGITQVFLLMNLNMYHSPLLNTVLQTLTHMSIEVMELKKMFYFHEASNGGSSNGPPAIGHCSNSERTPSPPTSIRPAKFKLQKLLPHTQPYMTSTHNVLMPSSRHIRDFPPSKDSVK